MNKLPWNTEKEFYDMHASRMFKKDSFYHVGFMGNSPEENAQYLINILNLKPNDMVVDLGCGSGFLTHMMGKVCKSIGISNSIECIHQAKLNYPNDNFVLGNMENIEIEGVTHFVCLESIGYASVKKTLNNAYKLLPDGGVFLITDTTLISHPNDCELQNIAYWENYWKYFTLNVPDMIVAGYKAGFMLTHFKDFTRDPKLNLRPFMETLKDNIVEQNYPFPDMPVQILTEFVFQKKQRERWVNPYI